MPGSVQMELACNCNAGALCEHIQRADHWIFRICHRAPAPVFTRNVSLMDLSQGQN